MSINTESPATLVVAVIGESGAGKTAISAALVNLNSELYVQCRQVTTRDRREGESDDHYDFIDNEHYDFIKDGLVACTSIHKVGEVGITNYGTRFENDPSLIHLVVVNELGLTNLKRDLFENDRNSNCHLMVLGITRNGTNDAPETYIQRHGRSEEYVQNEIKWVVGYTKDESAPREMNTALIQNSFQTSIEEHAVMAHDIIMMVATGKPPAMIDTALNTEQYSPLSENTEDDGSEPLNTEAVNDR